MMNRVLPGHGAYRVGGVELSVQQVTNLDRHRGIVWGRYAPSADPTTTEVRDGI